MCQLGTSTLAVPTPGSVSPSIETIPFQRFCHERIRQHPNIYSWVNGFDKTVVHSLHDDHQQRCTDDGHTKCHALFYSLVHCLRPSDRDHAHGWRLVLCRSSEHRWEDRLRRLARALMCKLHELRHWEHIWHTRRISVCECVWCERYRAVQTCCWLLSTSSCGKWKH